MSNFVGTGVVAQFLSAIDKKTGFAVYRGQSPCALPAIPSAFRNGARGIRSYPTLTSWKKYARPYLALPPQTDLEWLALAQHHGVPTGLLDWTVNPLVALFFASGPPSDQPGEVIKLPVGLFNSLDHSLLVNPFEADRDNEIMRLSGSGLNHRSDAQGSLMTLHRHTVDGTANPLRHLEYTEVIYTVQPQEKPAVRQSLMHVGVSELTIFADLSTSVAAFKRVLAETTTDMPVTWPWTPTKARAG